MQPFSIQCEKCNSRLKVRKASAIGQTLGCPKCGNKIKIVPPESIGNSSRGEPGSSSKSSIAASKQTNTPDNTSPGQRTSDASAPEPAANFEDMDQLLAGLEQGTISEPETATSSSDTSTATIDEVVSSSSDSESPEPTPYAPPEKTDEIGRPDWTSTSTQGRQKFTMILSGVIGIVVIAAIMIGYLAFRLSKPDQQVVENDPDDLERVLDDVRSEPETGSDEASSTDPLSDNENGDVPLLTDDNAEDPGETLPPGNEDPNLVEPVEGDGGEDAPPIPFAEEGSTSTNNTEETADEDPDSSASPPGFSPRIAEGGPDGIGSILSGLDDFGEFIEDSGFESARDEAIAVLREDAWLVSDRELPFVERETARVLKVSAQLDTPVIQLSIPNTTLDQLLALLRDLSGVSIGIDESALATVPDLKERTFSIEISDTTVAGVLDSVLSDLGLMAQPQTLSASIVSRSIIGPRAEKRFEVAGIVAGFPKGGDDLIQFITALIAPQGWVDQGGEGIIRMDGEQLVVEQTPDIHYSIESLLQRLRKIRGLADDPAIRTTPLIELAAPCLAEPFNFRQIEPIPIQDLLREVEESANITITCDWESLSSEGWAPYTVMPLMVRDGDINEAMRRLAASLEIGFVTTGERQFKLLSKKAYESHPNIEFYDCTPLLEAGVSIDELASQIVSIFPPIDANGPQNRFYFDAASQHVMARLTQQQQKALLQFLRSWTESATR